MKKCITKNCKNKTVNSKCNSCRSREYRAKYPMRYAYNNSKSNAKRRKKIFNLTFQEYEQFCTPANYIAGKGRTKDSFSIDCIDPTKGYVVGNLQILSISNNSKKSNRLIYDWQMKTATVIKSAEIDNSKNVF